MVLIKAIFAVIHAVLQAVASTLLAMGSVAVVAVLVVAALVFAVVLGVSGLGGARLVRKRRDRDGQ